ncbi:MAG TPA: biotin/lipoyl-containing protein, partial [Nevskiaceae bacterium]|nr:biotin/lipoyl-containing protein [Nevskiaceae bacterium]
DLASYLMYPAVFKDYARYRRDYGDLAILPTPAFFYGLKEGEETSVDLERGKTLIIRYITTTAEAGADGKRRVIFELNGQSRAVVVAEHGAAQVTARPKADPTDSGQVAAPMPGMVGSVAAVVGRHVEVGDALLTIEAMKMETTLTAAVAGSVKEVLVVPGARVEAKDLLVRIAA